MQMKKNKTKITPNSTIQSIKFFNKSFNLTTFKSEDLFLGY